MIDVHCHLLPGIDDGPQTMEESITLAQLAVQNGITHAVVTPHIHLGRWNNEAITISHLMHQLQMRLTAANIPLQLGMAAEVRLDAQIMQWLAQDKIPFLGTYNGKRVMLLELPHANIPLGTDNLISWLLKRDIQPLIAHPERNKEIMRSVDKIRPLLRLGCLLQVTAGSVVGLFGKPAQRCARELLDMGAVFVLASDAHNVHNRPPDLISGRDAASEIVGAEMAHQLVTTRPFELVASQFSALNHSASS